MECAYIYTMYIYLHLFSGTRYTCTHRKRERRRKERKGEGDKERRKGEEGKERKRGGKEKKRKREIYQLQEMIEICNYECY